MKDKKRYNASLKKEKIVRNAIDKPAIVVVYSFFGMQPLIE